MGNLCLLNSRLPRNAYISGEVMTWLTYFVLGLLSAPIVLMLVFELLFRIAIDHGPVGDGAKRL